MYAYALANPVNWTDPTGKCVPYVDRDCLPVWKIGQGANWEDFGNYWSNVGNTAKDAVVGPAQMLYAVATQEEARSRVARGAQVLVNNPLESAEVVLAAATTPFTDIYYGIVCGDSMQIGRGLTGFGLLLGGARLARYPRTAVNGRIDFLAGAGRRGGVLYGEQKLAMLRNYLNRRGVDLLVGEKHLPAGKAGGFDYMSPRPTLRLRSNPTEYEVWHELSHYIQYRRIGPEAYRTLSRTAEWNAAEPFVFDMLNRTRRWSKLNEAEQMHASQYIEDVGGIR